MATLFGIDAATDTLVRQGGPDGTPSPNGGVLTTIGPLGVDTTTNAGFDIETSFGGDTPLDTGYVSLTPAATPTASNFYTVNLTTGGLTQQGTGPIAGGFAIESVALPLTTSARFASAVDADGRVGHRDGHDHPKRAGHEPRRLGELRDRTGAGSAASAADFTATNGTLTFPSDVARLRSRYRSQRIPRTSPTRRSR